MTDNLDFEKEFASDEEVDRMLDGLVDLIKREEKRDSVSVANPKKVQAVLYTYKVLRYLAKGTGAKVTYELYKPFKSTGSVSIVGRNLEFTNTKWFMAAVELASNFNVYPKIDGTVRIDFTFHGLTTTLK